MPTRQHRTERSPRQDPRCRPSSTVRSTTTMCTNTGAWSPAAAWPLAQREQSPVQSSCCPSLAVCVLCRPTQLKLPVALPSSYFLSSADTWFCRPTSRRCCRSKGCLQRWVELTAPAGAPRVPCSPATRRLAHVVAARVKYSCFASRCAGRRPCCRLSLSNGAHTLLTPPVSPSHAHADRVARYRRAAVPRLGALRHPPARAAHHVVPVRAHSSLFEEQHTHSNSSRSLSHALVSTTGGR